VVVGKDGDGNDMNIYITKPYKYSQQVDKQPCFMYLRCGGAILFTSKKFNEYGLDKRFAVKLGAPVIMPEFRNAPDIK